MEYVIYKRQMKPAKKKGDLPDVYNMYLSDSIYNPSYSSNLDNAERFYDLDEAKETAYLLDMQVGQIELTVRRV